jgi:hypothetical protein
MSQARLALQQLLLVLFILFKIQQAVREELIMELILPLHIGEQGLLRPEVMLYMEIHLLLPKIYI